MLKFIKGRRKQKQINRVTDMTRAIDGGDISKVKHLLTSKDVEFTQENMSDFLIEAIYCDSVVAAEILLGHNANITKEVVSVAEENHFLEVAVYCNSINVAKSLIHYGVPVTEEAKRIAKEKGNTAMCLLLSRKRAKA